jgi:hypothetical protein
MKISFLLLMTATAFATMSGAARAGDAGLIAGVTGDVKVMRAPGAKWSKASVMQTLPAGSSIQVAAGGSAIVVLFEGGARFRLAGGSVSSVAAAAVRGVSGPAAKALPALQIRQAKLLAGSRVAGGRAASTVVRGGSARIELQSLSATSIQQERPLFRWDAVPGAASYKLRLSDADDQIIWQTSAQNTGIAYPPDAVALTPEVDYLWTVTTTVDNTIFKGEGIFRVLSADKRKAVQDELAALDQPKDDEAYDEATSGVLRAEVFARHQLWDDAIMTYQQLAQKFPDADAIGAALSSLLAGQARTDKAHPPKAVAPEK